MTRNKRTLFSLATAVVAILLLSQTTTTDALGATNIFAFFRKRRQKFLSQRQAEDEQEAKRGVVPMPDNNEPVVFPAAPEKDDRNQSAWMASAWKKK